MDETGAWTAVAYVYGEELGGFIIVYAFADCGDSNTGWEEEELYSLMGCFLS